jgi:hypothetical protein
MKLTRLAGLALVLFAASALAQGFGSTFFAVGDNTYVNRQTDGVAGIGSTSSTSRDGTLEVERLSLLERTSNPTPDPAEGEGFFWLSDGAGNGDDGDVMWTGTAGGNTYTITVVDHSSGS